MVDKILHFPRQVLMSNKSINAIVADLAENYPDGLPDIDALIVGLRLDEKLVDEWIAYSENKRSTPNWFFLKQGNTFKVGYLALDRVCNEGIFKDSCFACALFIMSEMGRRISTLKHNSVT